MEKETKQALRRKILGWAGIMLCSLAWLAFCSAAWYRRIYGDIGFDSVLFTLTSSTESVDTGLIVSYLRGGLLPTVLGILAQGGVLFLLRRWKKLPSRALSAALAVVLVLQAGVEIGLFPFIVNRLQRTDLYERAYVDPASVQIQFPDQKRNLIYIYLESMESSYLDKGRGGAMEQNIIPELTALAQENINFSHNEGVGGLVELPGTTWSVGASVAQTTGVPLFVPNDLGDVLSVFGQKGEFLPGITSLCSILAENGYYQALMMGCDASFGGERVYAETHGVNKIYDLRTAWQDGIVPRDYFAWWGFEDKHLFRYAQQELTKISQQGQPFAFTMLTMDTHHPNGYTCDLCSRDHGDPYENVLACSSRQVAEFIRWLQAQPFYENTTVILSGDHFSMDARYFARKGQKDFPRHGYNCILNAPLQPEREKNRIFSSVDMFPTTLAALGCRIEGDRLGFGVNLFSQLDTLPEQYGYRELCRELKKTTGFYDKFYKPEDHGRKDRK